MAHKTLTKSISIDLAKQSHNCRFNKIHRIRQGEKRLKVKEGRSTAHYCIQCGKIFLREGIDRLNAILTEL